VQRASAFKPKFRYSCAALHTEESLRRILVSASADLPAPMPELLKLNGAVLLAIAAYHGVTSFHIFRSKSV